MMRWLLALFISFHTWASTSDSVAFFYGQHQPLAEMTFYPGVVVQPDHISAEELKWLNERGIKTYAYLSVGESDAKDAKGLKVNASWQSQIMDLTSDRWKNHLSTRAQKLKARGFYGLFLDTLDSYQQLPQDQQPAQRQALLAAVQSLSGQFQHHLILNRGFELLPWLKGQAERVVAEGLLSHFNPEDNSYKGTSQADQQWLSAQLNTAKALGFAVQVIDYAPFAKRAAMAQQIAKAGFAPWVTDGHLLTWGSSELTPVPRRVIVPFDSTLQPLINTQVHQRLSTLIEYLGYLPDYIDISKEPLPPADKALFAGVVVWAESSAFYRPELVSWLENVQGKLPELLLGEIPQAPALLAGLGLNLQSASPKGPFSQTEMAPWLKGETALSLKNLEPYSGTLVEGAEALITIKDGSGEPVLQGARTNKGAVVLSPWLIDALPLEENRWLINPVALLQKGLGLAPIPAPDVTTESGRRLFTLHIDGDAFPSRARFPGQPFAGEVIEKQIIEHYRLPITVSVIQGEVGPTGMYPKESPQLEAIARDIFKKPYVEIASHTYSHPFFWSQIAGREKLTEEDTEYGFHLTIPGYNKIDLTKEIDGSIDYINERLAPKDKKVVMMLWSGDAAPGPVALAHARKMGVLNVNGGNTVMTRDNPSLSEIWPIGRPEGDLLYQVYAPIMNENVYTDLWHGPYFGFRRVRETFDITGHPYRLKPFGLYFHFYSGTNPAGLQALRDDIGYVLSRPNTPAHLSHYARMAKDFYFSALARDAKGDWLLSSKYLRTLRLPKALGYAQLDASQGLAGATEDGRYLHVVNGDARFALASSVSPRKPYLVSANVLLKSWQLPGKVAFKAWQKADLILANAEGCRFVSDQGPSYGGQQKGRLTEFSLPEGDFAGHFACGTQQ